ncbi:MAG: YebC/PmpR family DNA-binding transcriptional regulator [Defluviitaleaceae bacterium]|nr:YebC/PmpR family DNA-binding transcriptional regulator [Defluviitaleaceae bacterium]
MAGHSKFANIKHRKEKNDSIRGKIFTRLGREIAVAVKAGGADPASNGKLRDAVVKARANNMSNDTIERSIKKAAGDLSSVNYEQIFYEGYGPGGVALIVEALTDNRNRAAANIRNAFTKGGGNMGPGGCVAFMFDDRGVIMVEGEPADEDRFMELALDAGALEFNMLEQDGAVIFEILTAPEDFSAVCAAFESAGIEMLSAEVTKVPQTTARLIADEDIKKMNKLLALLDDDDDVQNVWNNWEDSL